MSGRVNSYRNFGLIDGGVPFIPGDDGRRLGPESLTHQLVVFSNSNVLRFLNDGNGDRSN